jgi:hypothetical protein
VNAGPLGFALHVAAITWCCRNLTDGFIPRSKVRALLDLEGLHVTTGQGEFVVHQKAVDAFDLADQLVVVGLWIEDEDRRGYWLHDFLVYNPPRERVMTERARATERKQKSRMYTVRDPDRPKSSQAKSRRDAPVTADGVTTEDRNGLATDSHGPGPDPVPLRDQDPPPTRAREGSTSVVVSADLPLEYDAQNIWDAKTITARPSGTVAEVWALFAGHFAGQVFPNRAAVLGRWGNWIARQTKYDAKERVREQDSARGKRGAEITKQPFDPNAPWMKLEETGS